MITARIGHPALTRTAFTSRLGQLHPNVIAKRSYRQRPFSRRVAKSGSRWTLNDLESFNIHLEQQDPLTFFGVQQLPEPAIHPGRLKVRDADADAMFRNLYAAGLLTSLKHAMGPGRRGELDAIQFARELLRLMGYGGGGLVCTESVHSFVMCGEYQRAATDLCIVDSLCSQHSNVLFILEVRNIEDPEPVGNAQAQLVAQAVAAFTESNANRREAGLGPVLGKVMPGIVMVGTSPMFFKIPVSETLLSHIRHGTCPPDITTVTFCRPPVPRPTRWRKEGMVPLDARRQILSCFQAFKPFVGI